MSWQRAEKYLLQSMVWSGAKYLARVAFDEGDGERVMEIGVATFCEGDAPPPKKRRPRRTMPEREAGAGPGGCAWESGSDDGEDWESDLENDHPPQGERRRARPKRAAVAGP